MRLSELISYYKKVAPELVRLAQGREVAVKFGEAGYGKRPDTLQFPSDVLAQVRNGATSFHVSEELWQNPMQLASESSKKQLDELRAGWDLVLDIDCKNLEWSKACAELLMEALKWHEVQCATIKFSGGTGWHVAVPGMALSEERQPFPETPQIIAKYLKAFIRPHLARKILEIEKDIKKLVEKSGKKREEIMKNGEFDPFSVLEIDTILIASRHLFRMPYSLNEKKWLVSIPIKPKDLKNFKTDWAKPENIETIDNSFLNTEKVKEGEASQLLTQALDWNFKATIQKDKETTKEYFEFTEKVPREAFPPCMNCILAGLPDGRKRGLFALMNFMRLSKWDWPELEAELKAWNSRNAQPLKEGYIRSQLSWHKRHPEKIPPPNCKQFYHDFGVCCPDNICQKIKNPLSYPRFKIKKQT